MIWNSRKTNSQRRSNRKSGASIITRRSLSSSFPTIFCSRSFSLLFLRDSQAVGLTRVDDPRKINSEIRRSGEVSLEEIQACRQASAVLYIAKEKRNVN